MTAFGTILLKDDLGNKMANIRKRVREDPEEMAMEVLRVADRKGGGGVVGEPHSNSEGLWPTSL